MASRSRSTRRRSPRALHDLGLRDRADRQGPLRAVHGPLWSLRRELARQSRHSDHRTGLVRRASRGAPGIRLSRVRDPRRDGAAALRQVDAREHPEALAASTRSSTPRLNVNAAGGGDTGAPAGEVQRRATRVVPHGLGRRPNDRWLESKPDDADWFCWMSFPDPHHPWDPPSSESHRVPGATWRCPRTTQRPRRADASRSWIKRPATGASGTRDARVQLRGAGQVGARHDDRRSGARGECPQRHRGGADR